ncbi:MAG TPA: FAD-dependent oxidoreductase [Candidatus Limnocylindria bacterium]|nr:FAD-dependent oxidoreductase [Candidatus Limnocylindria bacterium]
MPSERSVDVLLIGAGVASVRSARTLRRRKFDGSILIVGDEPVLPYNRPPLSKELLRGEVGFELIAAEPASWYDRQRVDLLTDAPVASLDPDARLASLADGSRIRFGQCLLATGAEPRRLPVPGGERALPLRTLADAESIRRRAVAGGRALVVGGGFIGVEVAASLASLGVAVSMVEMAPALWGGLLGETVSAWALGVLRDAGVDVRLGERLAALDDVETDVIVAGVGVTPRVDLAVSAGLGVDNGILTDARHATSAERIFAAGDVARVDGRRVEHWHAAREGGEAVALAMLGEPTTEPRAPWVYSEFAGHMFDVVGWAPAFDEELPLLGGRVVAYLVSGRVAQLAIIDSAISVDDARALVARGGSLGELRLMERNI